ncbi:HAD-like domain-containing protein [Xylariales sp. PMI_506]|nr:HAD-like domain-containing protein [Xylariales sp. PMI_506]
MTKSEYPDLTGFKALSFDCFGTLIDEDAGILPTLRFVTTQLPSGHPFSEDPPRRALRRFGELEAEIQTAQPRLIFNEVLSETLTALARELGVPLPDSVSEPLGNAPGVSWPAFPDSADALRRLARRYKLAVLSNVDNANMRAAASRQLGPAGPAIALYTAQDVGSYKPDRRNFEYLVGHARRDLDADADRGELLHVAHGLLSDHVPAKALGLRSVWITRGDAEPDAQLRGKVAYEWRFETVGELADEVERQFAAKGL